MTAARLYIKEFPNGAYAVHEEPTEGAVPYDCRACLDATGRACIDHAAIFEDWWERAGKHLDVGAPAYERKALAAAAFEAGGRLAPSVDSGTKPPTWDALAMALAGVRAVAKRDGCTECSVAHDTADRTLRAAGYPADGPWRTMSGTPVRHAGAAWNGPAQTDAVAPLKPLVLRPLGEILTKALESRGLGVPEDRSLTEAVASMGASLAKASPPGISVDATFNRPGAYVSIVDADKAAPVRAIADVHQGFDLAGAIHARPFDEPTPSRMTVDLKRPVFAVYHRPEGAGYPTITCINADRPSDVVAEATRLGPTPVEKFSLIDTHRGDHVVCSWYGHGEGIPVDPVVKMKPMKERGAELARMMWAHSTCVKCGRFVSEHTIRRGEDAALECPIAPGGGA